MVEAEASGRSVNGRRGRTSWFALTVALAVVLTPHGAAAQDGSAEIWKYLRLDLGTWITTGHGEWAIDFDVPPSESGGATVVGGRSILEFEHLTNPLITARAEVQPRYWLALDAALSLGASMSGRVTDTDLSRLANGDVMLAIVSKAELGGDTTIFSTNAYLRVAPFMRESENFADVFIGYVFYSDSLDITDGQQLFNIDAPQAVGPIPGLNSQYDFSWKGLRLGVRGELVASRRFTVRAKVALIPWTTFEGKGFWNLRDLHFTQEADGGIGVDALLSLRFQVARLVGLELGFQYMALHVEDGEDTKVFSGGEVIVSELAEVDSSRYGPFLLLSVGF